MSNNQKDNKETAKSYLWVETWQEVVSTTAGSVALCWTFFLIDKGYWLTGILLLIVGVVLVRLRWVEEVRRPA